MSAWSVALCTLILSFCIRNIESSNIARALFNVANTGIDGFFGIYNGFFWYELDFFEVDWDSESLPANCSDGGLHFHLHTQWTYTDTEKTVDTADKMGDACHFNYTGGHYDPWFACGPNSASPDCEVNGGCIPPSSVFEESDLYTESYLCDPDNYDLVSYACESGDWSGKYGKLYPLVWSNDTNDTIGDFLKLETGSYWEIQEEPLMTLNGNDLASWSIVIHCEDGEPAFCAPVVREQNANVPPIDITDPEVIEISFEEAGVEYEAFTITWNNLGVTFNIPESVGAICSEWYVRLYEEYPYGEGDNAVSGAVDCDLDEFGGIYDPTHTCVEGSGSAYCVDGRRCNTTDANYDCSGDFRGCAVGDISARIGSIIYNTATGGDQTIEKEDPQSPPLFILNKRGIVMECVETGTNITNICSGTVCANCTELEPINNITSAPTSPTALPSINPTRSPTNEPTLEPTMSPSDSSEEEEKKGLSGGAVTGIIIGVVALCCLIVVLVYCLVIKPRNDDGDATKDSVEMNKMKSNSGVGDGDDGVTEPFSGDSD